MDQLLNNAPCGFLVVKDNGEVVEINETLLKLLGYKRKELSKVHIEKIFSVGARIFYQTHVFPLLKLQGNISEIYIDLKAKEGKTVPVLLNANRRERNGEKFSDFIFVPIYQRNQFEDELILAKKEAEGANRAKDDFLSMVSHELRTPLNAILGWAKILSKGNSNFDTINKGLETIKRNAKIQTELIEDILDFSRIISGRMQLDVHEINLEELIEDAIDVITPAANAKQISIETTLDSSATISGDDRRILQVLWNLLNNAVKFTPKGGSIKIFLQKVNSNIEIIVSDTGQGISEDYLPYVFDRFEQKDKSITRRHSGLGLGLAITSHIVELHGGTIRAESPGEGFGATFTIQLPVTMVYGKDKNIETTNTYVGTHQKDTYSSNSSDKRLAGIKILFVDDETDARELITHILTNEGAFVTDAKSVAKATRKWLKNDFDIIISDIEMPKEDGFALIKKLKAFNESNEKQIPAIALTAHALSSERLKILSAGFKMHLAKPVDPEELVTVIINFVT